MATVKRTIEEEHKHLEQEYQNHFNSEAYLREFVNENNPYFRFTLTALHSVFAIEVTSGDSLLEFGCGPNICSLIAASRRFKNIVVSDFVTSNRNTISKWLRADADCHDFSGIFKTAAALENNPNYHELEERVRQNVKEVIPCNAHLTNPIAPDQRQFDVIVSCYAIEASSLRLESYRKAMENVSSLLKPGGKFVLVGNLHSSSYIVGGHDFREQAVTKENVEEALIAADLHPIQWNLKTFSEEESSLKGPSDTDHIFMALSTKGPK